MFVRLRERRRRAMTFTTNQIDAMLNVQKTMIEDPRFAQMSADEKQVRTSLYGKMLLASLFPTEEQKGVLSSNVSLSIPEARLVERFVAIARQQGTWKE